MCYCCRNVFVVLMCRDLITTYSRMKVSRRIYEDPPRITNWHHEACRVMTNGDGEGWIFLMSIGDPRDGFFYPILTQIMDVFFLFTSTNLILF